MSRTEPLPDQSTMDESLDLGWELRAVDVTRAAQDEMFERVIAKLESLPVKGKYPPDQIVAILRREFSRESDEEQHNV